MFTLFPQTLSTLEKMCTFCIAELTASQKKKSINPHQTPFLPQHTSHDDNTAGAGKDSDFLQGCCRSVSPRIGQNIYCNPSHLYQVTYTAFLVHPLPGPVSLLTTPDHSLQCLSKILDRLVCAWWGMRGKEGGKCPGNSRQQTTSAYKTRSWSTARASGMH